MYKKIHDRKIKTLNLEVKSILSDPKQIYSKIKNMFIYIINIKSIMKLGSLTNKLILKYQQDGKFDKKDLDDLHYMLSELSPDIVNISGLLDM